MEDQFSEEKFCLDDRIHRNLHKECKDDDLRDYIRSWRSGLNLRPTMMEVFRAYDEITLMMAHESIASYALTKELERLLELHMKKENVSIKELSNKAMWRDEDNAYW